MPASVRTWVFQFSFRRQKFLTPLRRSLSWRHVDAISVGARKGSVSGDAVQQGFHLEAVGPVLLEVGDNLLLEAVLISHPQTHACTMHATLHKPGLVFTALDENFFEFPA